MYTLFRERFKPKTPAKKFSNRRAATTGKMGENESAFDYNNLSMAERLCFAERQKSKPSGVSLREQRGRTRAQSNPREVAPVRKPASIEIFGISIALLCCIGCRSDPVSVVRDGVLSGHSSTTIGRAFEATFQNPSWTSSVSPKGATLVEFQGTIPLGTLNRAGFVEAFYPSQVDLTNLRNCFTAANVVPAPDDNSLRNANLEFVGPPESIEPCLKAEHRRIADTTKLSVKFRFVIAVNNRAIDVDYIDSNIFGSTDRVLAFVYQ
jgi:hypothetical protein